jgi:fructose-bisphosphate aldolase class I
MNTQELTVTAATLVGTGKGLLAMDESVATCYTRFAQARLPRTPQLRHAYREWLVATPGLGDFISGAILHDETIRQHPADGTPLVQLLANAGIIAGTKVDTGTHDLAGFPGESATDGLDGLRERLAEYRRLGARSAKWRAVITISDKLPTSGCVQANAHALARYAAPCQEAGLVPMVEPEVLMDGDHTLQRCGQVTEDVLRTVFHQLHAQRVALEGLILKSNMVLPGSACPKDETVDAVADATVTALLRTVPGAVAGIAFLSGGQSGQAASAHLNAMHTPHRPRVPWPLTFSFARAIQQPALEIWHGETTQVPAGQQALLHRARWGAPGGSRDCWWAACRRRAATTRGRG